MKQRRDKKGKQNENSRLNKTRNLKKDKRYKIEIHCAI